MQEDLIQLLMTFGLLGGAYVSGTLLERRHYKRILLREGVLSGVPAITLKNPPAAWGTLSGELVTGSVVVSLDYYKRFAAGWRNLVGGRVGSYESLLDRARREAVIRMKAEARLKGYDAVINTRIETSRLASGRRDGKGTAGVEVLAFGTAIRRGSGLLAATDHETPTERTKT